MHFCVGKLVTLIYMPGHEFKLLIETLFDQKYEEISDHKGNI